MSSSVEAPGAPSCMLLEGGHPAALGEDGELDATGEV